MAVSIGASTNDRRRKMAAERSTVSAQGRGGQDREITHDEFDLLPRSGQDVVSTPGGLRATFIFVVERVRRGPSAWRGKFTIIDVHDTFGGCASARDALPAAAAATALSLDAPVVATSHTRVLFWNRRSRPARAHRSMGWVVAGRTRARMLRGLWQRIRTAVCHRRGMAGRSVMGRGG